jgi:hypothetical protein
MRRRQGQVDGDPPQAEGDERDDPETTGQPQFAYKKPRISRYSSMLSFVSVFISSNLLQDIWLTGEVVMALGLRSSSHFKYKMC